MKQQKRNHQRWTTEETEKLRQLVGNLPFRTIAEKLGRSEDSIKSRSRILGLRMRISKTQWTDEAIAYVKTHFHAKTNAEIAEGLGVSEKAVRSLRQKLNLRRRNIRKWTKRDQSLLKRHYGKTDTESLAKHFGVTREKLHAAAHRFGLAKKRPPRFTQSELDFIRENYRRMKNTEIAERLGRKKESIEVKACRNGWSRRDTETYKPFTGQEDEFILRNIGVMTLKEIANHLSRKYISIYLHLRVLRSRAQRKAE